MDDNNEIFDDIDSLDDVQEQYEDNENDNSDDSSNNSQRTQKTKNEEAFDRKFDEEGNYNKDYYKEQSEKLKQERQEYKANNGYKEQKAEAKENLKDAKEKYKSAKKNNQPNTNAAATVPAKEGVDQAKEGAQDAKDGVKEAKEGVEKARDALNDVKDKAHSGRVNPLRQAGNKVGSARSKAYNVMHPVKATKKKIKNKVFSPYYKAKKKVTNAAKKAAKNATKRAAKAAAKGAKVAGKAAIEAGKAAAKVAAEGIKVIIELAIEFWPVTLCILAIGLIIAVVMFIASMTGTETVTTSNYSGSVIASTTCDYSGLNGVNADTKIELISCHSPFTVVEIIPFEKYVAGVAIAEMGEDYNEEAIKAQLIAVRSYTLTRKIPEYTVGYDASKNVIRMRWCENDQVYWDYTKDIYRESGKNVATYSYDKSSGYPLWKKALSKEKQASYEALARTVSGMYVVNADEKIMNTDYVDSTTQSFIRQAKENAGTANGSYTAILLKHYTGSNKVVKANCATSNYYTGAIGEFSKWKQSCYLGAPWCNDRLADDDTIGHSGCNAVSVAMLIAQSGLDTSNVGKYSSKYATEGFNPGTFVDAMRQVGGIDRTYGSTLYGAIPKLVPGFSYVGMLGSSPSYSDIQAKADAGYYVMLKVSTTRGHFVALDAKSSAANGWKKIFMWDPASEDTIIGEGDTGKNYKILNMLWFKASK